MFGTGVSAVGLVVLVLLGFVIATTVNTFAMEAAVLFTPAFMFVFPVLVPGFPSVGVNAAIGLALFVELFGYSSSVSAYWFRHQIDFHVAAKLLAITVPVAVVARVGSYLVPSDLLMLAFGGLLVTLSVVLYESHERGPSILDTLLEKPVLGLTDAVPDEYEPRTRVLADGGTVEAGTRDGFDLEPLDTAVTFVGGLLAGLVGIAVGELTQTMLTVRKKVPIDVSTGTSALVLHVTIVAALVTNLLLLRFAPAIAGEGFTVPFGVGTFVAVGCLFGGQMGAFLNNRLSEETVLQMLMVAYFVIGVFVVGRTLLAGTAH
ncbi:TSUP family transporter [Halomarina salina]|uniref:Probable membrane transporter protein n=1 Tax=Halomarina salina TaxID=1872699 RepID=A0ABD5RKJ3_9EURY|nr:sulfite exporter TauE/SafE family protein [Halomarina salina]